MKLRPYHNPENVDESKVPDGWRFRYADEAGKLEPGPCRTFVGPDVWLTVIGGSCLSWTYIVPVNA